MIFSANLRARERSLKNKKEIKREGREKGEKRRKKKGKAWLGSLILAETLWILQDCKASKVGQCFFKPNLIS